MLGLLGRVPATRFALERPRLPISAAGAPRSNVEKVATLTQEFADDRVVRRVGYMLHALAAAIPDDLQASIDDVLRRADVGTVKFLRGFDRGSLDTRWKLRVPQGAQ